ncbi:MAG: signal peptidase I [Candidatus Limnocylindria bacterium]
MKRLWQICSMALAVALLSMCLGLVAVRTLGMGTFVVTGSSMEPAIQKGALAIVEPVSPSLVVRGDIITFEHYGQMTTHRVIAIDASNAASPTFTTKGDANVVADPEPVHFPGQVGIYRTSVPLLGYAIVYAQAYWRIALTAIAAIVFVVCAAMLVFGNAKPMRPRSRRQAVQRATIDRDELWADHMGWLREATGRRIAA